MRFKKSGAGESDGQPVEHGFHNGVPEEQPGEAGVLKTSFFFFQENPIIN